MGKFFKLIVLSALLAFTAISCNSGSTIQETQDLTSNDFGLIQDGIIYVATSPDYPPFEYLEGDKISGFDIDLLTALAKKAGLKVEFAPVSFETIVPSVAAGKYDMGIGGLTITEEDSNVLFSIPYYRSGQVAILPKDSKYNTIEDLKGKRLGAGIETTGYEIASELSDNLTPITAEMALPMLLNGQLDGYICDVAVAENATASGQYKKSTGSLLDEEIGMVFKADNQVLADEMNMLLEDYMKTEDYILLKEKYGI